MAEQRAEPGGSHGTPTLAALQGNEQGARVGKRPFQPQIFFKDLPDLRWQGENARFVPFAKDPHLRIGQLEIVELKRQHLARTQPIEQHQSYQGKIAKGTKAAPESGDILRRQRHTDAPGLTKTEARGYGTARPAITERRSLRVG